jgi:hypothetical protein
MMTCRFLALSAVALTLLASPALAYSSGAGGCSALTGHGTSAQSGAGGYTLTHDGGASPSPGTQVTVTLTGSSTFMGFILKTDAGTLAVKDGTNSKTVSACSGAIGHRSAAGKSSVEAYLTLPATGGTTVTVSAQALTSKMTVYELSTTITTAASNDPSPPPSPPPPPPAPLQLVAPAGCDPSSLGYACSAKINGGKTSDHSDHSDHNHRRRLLGASSSSAGEIIVHWTPGGVDLTAAGLSSDVAVSHGHVAFAVQAKVAAGHSVGLSFQETNSAMVPADAVIGWMGSDGSNGQVGSYRLAGYSASDVTPNNAGLPVYNTSVEATSSETVVKFTAAAHDIGKERVVANGGGVHSIGYAVSSSASKSYHDVTHGAVSLDLTTGKVTAVEAPGADQWRTHGLLMSIAFAAMAVGATSSLVAHTSLVPNSHMLNWHRFHYTTQAAASVIALVGLVLALDRDDADVNKPLDWSKGNADTVYKAHGAIGITVALIPVVQAMLGILREPAVGGSNPEGGDKTSNRAGTPKRSIHKVLGWSIVICGLLNCVFGAELLRRKLGDDPAPAVSSAVAFLVLVCVALIAKLLLWGKSLDEKDRVHAYIGNA